MNEILCGNGEDTVEQQLMKSVLLYKEDLAKTPGTYGWRARKGPVDSNTSGFRACGHRVLLLGQQEEEYETTAGGIVLPQKSQKQEQQHQVLAMVIEIGHDAWCDKCTDYCAVGDTVLIGQYVGKFHVSPRDGKTYRFVQDLDILTPVIGDNNG